jgi:hypothetical protein
MTGVNGFNEIPGNLIFKNKFPIARKNKFLLSRLHKHLVHTQEEQSLGCKL